MLQESVLVATQLPWGEDGYEPKVFKFCERNMLVCVTVMMLLRRGKDRDECVSSCYGLSHSCFDPVEKFCIPRLTLTVFVDLRGLVVLVLMSSE
jgi:hypothetical protein